MRHSRLGLENALAVVYLAAIDDDARVPDTFDEFTRERETELSCKTAAEIIYVEKDFGHCVNVVRC